MEDPRNAITYELFGINPSEFYATRFSDTGQVMPAPTELPAWFPRVLAYQKFELLVEAVGKAGASSLPLRVLDVGCGSGRFGRVLKHHYPKIHVTGLDMSEACVTTAIANKYDRAVCHDFNESLPFADETFDFVFSMDVFGHIEFRNKDRVIREIARVTKRGGDGFHGIEEGAVDYLSADPNDVDDAIRNYVYIDGHIGVETLDENVERFERYLEVMAAYSWLIPPIIEVPNALIHHAWGEDFSRDVEPLRTPEAHNLADAVLGHVNRRHLDLLLSAFGPILTRRHLLATIPEGPTRDYVLSMTGSGGFAMLGTRKA